MKAALPNNQGRPSLLGTGEAGRAGPDGWRSAVRLQERVFDLAGALTREYVGRPSARRPLMFFFRRCWTSCSGSSTRRWKSMTRSKRVDVFLSPYYGWVVERLVEAIRPDVSEGEPPEIPRYETSRPRGRHRR